MHNETIPNAADTAPALRGLARDLMRVAHFTTCARAGLDGIESIAEQNCARGSLLDLARHTSDALAHCDPDTVESSRDARTEALIDLAGALGLAVSECMAAARNACDTDPRRDLSVLFAAVEGLAAMAPGIVRRASISADEDRAAWAALDARAERERNELASVTG